MAFPASLMELVLRTGNAAAIIGAAVTDPVIDHVIDRVAVG
ncbi:MAG: hypothetical protein ACKOEO_17270 [Planctomycetaceae bacterium]